MVRKWSTVPISLSYTTPFLGYKEPIDTPLLSYKEPIETPIEL